MLNKLTIRNFKRFEEVEIDLGSPVVFVGPNNSGKTTALQALALWNVGLKRWLEKRSEASAAKSRPGVAVNRQDLLAVPVPAANLLWRDLRTRHVRREDGKQKTSNIRIDISVEGETEGRTWECGLEFDFANTESFYCRPRRSNAAEPERMEVPTEASSVNVAYLPPMSGLATNETRLNRGAINVRIGEGRTAEVLRNLCFLVYRQDPENWELLVEQIREMFGAELDPPIYVEERGELKMTYRETQETQTKERREATLDLSSSGRGLQQCMLLLAYMYSHPGTVVLLDEPDVHLEILRQREIYQHISRSAAGSGSQVIAASHSEVIMSEAGDQDTLVAFVGKPHRIDKHGQSQVLKALKSIGFEDYLLAEQKGWVLYLEGPTDLSILEAFARRLGHKKAARALKRVFVHHVGNNPAEVRNHFQGLKEACPELVGVALFDRLDPRPEANPVECLMWERREIENYFCSKSTLEAFAKETGRKAWGPGPLLAEIERRKRLEAMQEAIPEVVKAMEVLGKKSPWDRDTKVSDDFLTPLFKDYYKRLGLPNQMAKKSFYELAEYVPEEEIDPEIGEKLDAIAAVARSARAK